MPVSIALVLTGSHAKSNDELRKCKEETLKILMQAEKYPVLADMMRTQQKPWESDIKSSTILQDKFRSEGHASVMTMVALAYYLDVELHLYVMGGAFEFKTGDKPDVLVMYLDDEVNDEGYYDLVANIGGCYNIEGDPVNCEELDHIPLWSERWDRKGWTTVGQGLEWHAYQGIEYSDNYCKHEKGDHIWDQISQWDIGQERSVGERPGHYRECK